MNLYKRHRIIFIGSQNLGGLLDDGETIKNYYLKEGLKKYGHCIIEIDVRNKPSRIIYLLKLLYNLLFHRKSLIVVSASSQVAYAIFRMIKLMRWNMCKCYYWVIGGNFGNWIESEKFDKSVYQDLKKILVEGDTMKEQLNRCGLKNVMTLPNMKPIKYIPTKKVIKSDITKFVFLSRIIPEKGVDYIIEAAKQIVGDGITSFSVHFYGRLDESYRKEFLKKIQNNDNLVYGGFLSLSNNQGYDELSQFDMMLFPTYWVGEGFPGVIIDAYIAGLPVIASDWSLNKDLIDNGKTGLIIKTHDIKALKSAMMQVINKKIDIKSMSHNSQAKAMDFDLEKVMSPQLMKELNII